MSDVFEKAWYDQFKRNKRDRPELGTVSLDGVTAYPTVDSDEILYPTFEGGFRTGRPHNVEAFRNIDAGSKHLNPGSLSTGGIRPDAGILSVERKVRLPTGKMGKRTVAVANTMPLHNPFFRLDPNKQKAAYLGIPHLGKNPNRTAHMWTAGDLSQSEQDALISGQSTPQQILGMTDDLVLDRNDFGDSMLSWKFGDDLWEAPRFAYEVYDLRNKSLPHSKKWKFENREYRDDFALPFRPARGHQVSGSVDPLLRIPLHFAGQQAPELARQSKGGRYVEWVHPETGYRYEGVPVPLSLTGDYDQPAISRGISTGTHGLYFDPRDLTSAGREVWNAALTGDVIRRSLEVFDLRDDVLQKMPHPVEVKQRRPVTPDQFLPSPFKLQGVKNNPMYREIMQALKQTIGDRVIYEPFGGGGGLSQQFKAKRAVLNDINPDIGNFMRRIIREPFQIDSDKYNLSVGDPIMFQHPNFPQLGQMNLGTMTQERMDRFGQGKPTWLPAHFYQMRDRYNALRQKAAQGTATQEDYDLMSELFYMIQLTTMNGLVRYANSRQLPSWNNPYSVSPGVTRKKELLPVDAEIEEALMSRMREEGLYNEETGKYKGRIQPGGNLARITPFRGGGGMHDFSAWHDAMKDWEWRTGNAFDFYDDVKDELDPSKSLLTFDPPYYGEEGAHGFFNQEEQDRLISQIIDAKNRGIPTIVFNSHHPDIYQPLVDAGFYTENLDRMDLSGVKSETRGMKDELMALANVDLDSFLPAWKAMRGVDTGSQKSLTDFMGG